MKLGLDVEMEISERFSPFGITWSERRERWGEWQDIFKVMKGKNLQPRLLYPARISFTFDREMKTFRDKQKLRDFKIGRAHV